MDTGIIDNLIAESTNDQITIDPEKFDYRVKYPDESYEQYISGFEPNRKKRLFYKFVKRSVDIIVSALALIVLLPVFLILAIIIKCDSRGPIFFRQERVGRNGKLFICYKFRSMKTTAPKNCPTSEFENAEEHVTKIGKIIRRLSIDELPQLYCCLIGTMSLIGYRPLIPEEKECNDMREALGVLEFRPGITGYAQVVGRDDVYHKNKAILDAEYVKRASLLFDLKLIFQTVAVVFNRTGNRDA